MNKIYQSFLLISALCILCISQAIAAKFVQPPIQDLFKERNQVTVLEFKSVNQDESRATFSKVEDLWGTIDKKEIVLKVPKQWTDKFIEGEKYIIGHSLYRKHPLLRDEIQENPDGPSVLHPFVVDNAIFYDSKSLRYLFKELQDKEDPNAGKVLTKTLDILENAKENTRLLAAFQFQMSKPLFEGGLKDKHLDQLQKILKAETLTPEEEEFIIRASDDFPASMQKDWLVDHCRHTVEKHKSPYDLQTFIPLLVKTCASVLGNRGGKEDMPRLIKLLTGNHPGVAKSALRAIKQHADEDTPKLIATLLKENPNLHNETNGILQTFLYEFALEKEKGQKYKYD